MNLYKVGLPKWNLLRPRKNAAFHSYPVLFTPGSSKNSFILELKQRKKVFNDVLPDVVDTFIRKFDFKDMDNVTCWIKKVLNYNLTGGKLIRGVSTIMAYEVFEKPENITDESLRLSYVMGWCVEMLQTYGLLLDDIMDGSVTRRGVPCWYTLPNVGLRAINDSVLIFMTTTHTLESYFGHLPHYREIMSLINEVLVYTCTGQHLDNTMSNRGPNDYSKFTLNYYNTVANYKTSYSFKMSVCLGMLLANIIDKESQRKAGDICLKIGSLFQIQDDFLDVFKLESETGKVGSDIQNGKCTWLAVTALQLCNDVQRREFVKCYGSEDPGHVERIKTLYQDLNLPQVYRQEEKSRYDEVVHLANNFSDSLRATDLFLNLLDVIYNRKK